MYQTLHLRCQTASSFKESQSARFRRLSCKSLLLQRVKGSSRTFKTPKCKLDLRSGCKFQPGETHKCQDIWFNFQISIALHQKYPTAINFYTTPQFLESHFRPKDHSHAEYRCHTGRRAVVIDSKLILNAMGPPTPYWASPYILTVFVFAHLHVLRSKLLSWAPPPIPSWASPGRQHLLLIL